MSGSYLRNGGDGSLESTVLRAFIASQELLLELYPAAKHSIHAGTNRCIKVVGSGFCQVLKGLAVCVLCVGGGASLAQTVAFPSADQPPFDCHVYEAGDPVTFSASILADPGAPHIVMGSITLAIRAGASGSIVFPAMRGIDR